MRIALLLLALVPSGASAQLRYSATLGLTAGTRLVSDRIIREISVSQKPAPTVTLGASIPVSGRERLGLEAALAFGRTRIQESGLSDADGPGFRALGFTAGIEGPIVAGLSYRGGAGVVKYLPDESGIFREGGPLLLLLTGGADYHVSSRGKLGLVARLRYDYQRFSTGALESAGFSRSQDVHRVGIGFGVEFRS